MNRILLVDDDRLVLGALTRFLRGEGYEVVAHQDARVALEERGYGVVITDFMMPEMNGIEFLGELLQRNPGPVRMMLTAAADFHVASEAVNRGEIFRLLSKPWTLTELSSCVRQAFDHFRLVHENARLTRELAEKNAVLTSMNQNLEQLVRERTSGLLEGMVSALDYRDTETQWHSRRVSLYSRRLAEACGVRGDALDHIEQGALLHDVGKVGVRDSILLKPAKLTPEEWEEMRLHPEYGFRMLSKVAYLHEASLVVLHHHERWDGNGYPSGLSGERICLGARVFSVADTMDAICSDRPYRKGRPRQVAKDEIVRCSGTQFDPKVVEAFLGVPDEDWDAINARVHQMETEDVARWGGGITTPAKQEHQQRILRGA